MSDYAKKFPAPDGPEPPDPGPMPEDYAKVLAWGRDVKARKEWRQANRAHLVAWWTDRIRAQASGRDLTAVEVVTHLLAEHYLFGGDA